MGRATTRMASLAFVDGAGTPVVTPITDVGDFTCDALSPSGAEVVRIKERGVFAGAVKGDDVTGSGSFTVNVPTGADLHETSGTPSFLDAILNLSGGPAMTTVNDFTDGPRLLKLRYRITDSVDSKYRDILFDNCSFQASMKDGVPSSWSVKFEYDGYSIAEAAIS